MTTLTSTNPIYQDGPLAQALITYQEDLQRLTVEREARRKADNAEEAKRLATLLEKLGERLGDEAWNALSPYIVKRELDGHEEIAILVQLPECELIKIRYQTSGYLKVMVLFYDYAITFNNKQPFAKIHLGELVATAHSEWVEKTEKKRAQLEKYQALVAYAKAFTEYNREYYSILYKNQMALALLQEEYTTTFPVWSLTYGITAHSDEEGEFYADTRSVWVLSPDPDEDGFFPVIDDTGKVTHRKYYSLVYLDGPQTFQVDHGSTHCGHLHIKEANDSLYFSPLLNYAEVLTRARGWVEANMHPLPDPPLYAAFGLDERPDRWEIEELEKELSGEGENEIPF